MDRDAERRLMEDVLAGRVQPGSHETMGRLAELYLAHQSAGFPEKALILVRGAAKAVGPDDPIYPKLRHLKAKALRWSHPPEENQPGKAAEIERDAWRRSLKTAARDAIAFAAEWGLAWEHERWDEASEAYSDAHHALRRFLRRQVPEEPERLTQLQFTRYATRGAYAFAKLGSPLSSSSVPAT